MYTNFNHFFTVTTTYVWRINTKSRLPPHLYCVAAIPSKTRSTVGLHRWNVIRRHNGHCLCLTSCSSVDPYRRFKLDRVHFLFRNSFIRRWAPFFSVHKLFLSKQRLSFVILPILNHVKWLRALKHKTRRINTTWRNNIVTKYCCE